MVDLAETIFRDFETDGVSASGKHKPRKSKIREWGAYLEGFITAFTSNGGLIFDTRANLFASLSHDANTSAWVISDPIVAYNGIYRKVGASGSGSWTRVADLPYSFIRLTDAGAGTANAIIATSSIPLPGAASAALLVMNVFEANTGPVTLAANGAPAKPLKTNSGNDLASGYLTAGMVVAFLDGGASYRLLSDVASAAIVVAAEAAAAAAIAAAASLNLPTIQPGDADKVLAVRPDETGYLLKAPVSVPPPFVILSTGQSNMGNRLASTWTPVPNLKVWDFWGHLDAATDVGNAFSTPAADALRNTSMAAADRIAREWPNRTVYLIDIARGGLAIAEWGASPPTYAMRTAIANNVAAALSSIGVTKIDAFVWWQGESDTSNWAGPGTTTYLSDFEGVMDWLISQSWFENSTPSYIFGLPPFATSSSVHYWRQFTDRYIKRCVAKEPGYRAFVSVEDLPIDLWNPADSIPYIHMTSAGYKEAGEKLARAMLFGIYEPIARGQGEGASATVISAQTNLDSVAISGIYWTQQGNFVECFFTGVADATALGAATFEMTLPPEAVRAANPIFVAGTVNVYASTTGAGVITAVSPAANRVKVFYNAVVTGASTITGRFSYRLASIPD